MMPNGQASLPLWSAAAKRSGRAPCSTADSSTAACGFRTLMRERMWRTLRNGTANVGIMLRGSSCMIAVVTSPRQPYGRATEADEMIIELQGAAQLQRLPREQERGTHAINDHGIRLPQIVHRAEQPLVARRSANQARVVQPHHDHDAERAVQGLRPWLALE